MDELFDFLDDAADMAEPRRPSLALDQAWHNLIFHAGDDFCQEGFDHSVRHNRELTSSATSTGDADYKRGKPQGGSEGNCTVDCRSGTRARVFAGS